MPYKDRATRLAYLKAYRQAHWEKRKAERPAYDMARHANQRARLHHTAGRLTIHDIRIIFAGTIQCHYCKGTYLLGLDHVVPLALGGFNIRSNIVICCRSCNSSKYQQDRPWRWSRLRDGCADCGTNQRIHISKGLCNACYCRQRKNKRKATNPISD